MKPLIEIRSIPISIEYKVSRASIQKTRANATVELSRGRNGGYRVRSLPIKLSIDTFENRGEPMPRIAGRSNETTSPTYQATAQFTGSGHMQLNIDLEGNQAAANGSAATAMPQTAQPLLTQLPTPQYIPDYPSENSVSPVDISIMYEIDKLSFDLSSNSEFEFIPADIEFSVKEYPSIIFKYLGGPIYVPPSANPEYDPVDTFV